MLERLICVLIVALGFSQNGFSQLNAQFIADTTSNCEAITVSFTDQSAGNPTSWEWDFGNGQTSSSQNPSATFTNRKSYTVTLIVRDGTNSDTEVKQDYITIFNKPNAQYSTSLKTGCSPLSVTFTDLSTTGDASIQTYIWDFGDGSQPSALTNPTHTYQTSGNFPVSLQIIDQNACGSSILKDTIKVTPTPEAKFETYNRPDTCGTPHTVKFKNLSSNTSTSYRWTFGDGNTSTLAEPVHTYSGFGRYSVTLIASDPNCSDTLFFEDYIKLENTDANFTIPRDTACVGDSIRFTNLSSGSNRYSWNFGDGQLSAKTNPKYVYETGGLYEIDLFATILGSSCLSTHKDTILVQEVKANFSLLDTFSCFSAKFVGYIDSSFYADSLAWIVGVDPKKANASYIHQSIDTSFIVNDSKKVLVSQIAKNKFGCADTISLIDSITIFEIFADIDGITNDSVIVWDTVTPAKNILTYFGGCLPFEMNFEGRYFGPNTPISWSWDFGNGQASINQNTLPTRYFSDSIHTVTLTVRDDSGCILTDMVEVYGGVKPKANFNIFPNPDTLCFFDTVFIMDQATAVNGINLNIFQALKQGNTEINQTDTAGNFYFTQFRDTGSYAVRQIVQDNGCGDTLIKGEQLFMLGPIIDNLDFRANSCLDKTAVQFISATTGGTHFEWNFGDGSPPNTTDTNYVHTYPDYGRYWTTFKVWNDTNRCDTLFDSLFIDLRDLPPPEIEPFLKHFCLEEAKDTITFKEISLQGTYESFLWKMDGQTVSTAQSFRTDFKEKGQYILDLKVVDFFGCPDSVMDTVYIYQPEARIGSRFLSACLPLEVEFFDNSIFDTTISSWNWTFGNNQSSVQRVDTTTYSSNGFYDAYLRIENIFGCVDSILNPGQIRAEALNVSFAESNTEICVGDTVTFKNTSAGLNPQFKWDFGDGTVINDNSVFIKHQYNQGDTFTVVLSATDPNGCESFLRKEKLVIVDPLVMADFTSDTTQSNCYPLAVNFEDSSAGNIVSWEWRFGDGASSVFENPFHNYIRPGDFDVFLKVTSPNGCTDSISKNQFIKTEGPIAIFEISKDTACINEFVTFSILSSENVDSYSWDFGDGSIGSGSPVQHAYQTVGKVIPSIIVQDASGTCVVSIKDSLEIFNVQADFTINKDTACVPFEAAFNNQSIGEKTLRWNFGEGTTSTLENPSLAYNLEGNYTVSLAITSEQNCLDTAFKSLVVYPIPELLVTPDTGICLGDSVLLTARGGDRYLWRPARYLSDTLNDSVYSKAENTILYTVYTENEAGCKDTSTVEVFVPQPPNNKPLRDTSIFIGEIVSQDATAGERYTYQWTPPEGLSCDDCPTPNAQPLSTRTYIVTIKDNYGCFLVKDTVEIEVIEIYSLDVPKAFSPNGDGVNDVIFPKGWGLKDLLSFKIYNRFGELVFETSDFDVGWDGTYRGQIQNIETYIYTVEAVTFGNRILSKKGNISLLR